MDPEKRPLSGAQRLAVVSRSRRTEPPGSSGKDVEDGGTEACRGRKLRFAFQLADP